jgi:glycosyltransferase involved in cell wall biosynthesis
LYSLEEEMKVSIIIPVYKVEAYIVRCIESVLRQTYRNLEVILVDDCTPDRSVELAKEYIEQSPLSKDLQFVYLKHDHNRGLSAARNTGMDAATGEYIYFLVPEGQVSGINLD